MPEPRERNSLLNAVVDVLRAARESLKARDIAEQLGRGGNQSELRTEVNRLLYGALASFVEKDSSDAWRLTKDPQVTKRSHGSPAQHQTAVPHPTAPMPDSPSLQDPPGPTIAIDPVILKRIHDTLELWKRDLIQFGRRNKVLYFNSGRRTRLKLHAPTAPDLYSALVLHDKALTFGMPARGDIDQAELEDEIEPVGDVREKHGDIEVDYEASSASDVRALQRKLFRLRSDARTTLNELGINTLHVALGLLRWQESDTSKEWIESPILLVPASLDREKNGPYRLTGFEGDVVVNPALKHRLQHDFNLELPSFESYDGYGELPDVPGFFVAITRLGRERGWTVLPSAWLSHFSFEKLVMYEDLSVAGTEEAIATHDVLGAICEVSELDSPEIQIEDLESRFEAPDTYPVVDADSSQVEVIARARAGQSLVVQGPPGTGKSQTIVNLIAQSIRDGKSVLFVSEKRAALEVVHRRLREVGLSDLCLELHSHRANKREVVSDLYLAMQGSLEPVQAPDTRKFEARSALRRQLDAYAHALHKRRGKSRLSAFEVHGTLATLHTAPLLRAHLPVERFIDLSPEQEADLVRAVRALRATSTWDTADSHPWREAVFDEPAFVIQQDVMPGVASLLTALEGIKEAQAHYKRWTGSQPEANTLADTHGLVALIRILGAFPEVIPAVWLSGSADQFQKLKDLIQRTATELRACESLAGELRASDGEGLMNDAETVGPLAIRYRDDYGNLFSRLSRAFRRDRAGLRGLLGRKVGYQQSQRLLAAAKSYHESRGWLAAHRKEARQLAAIAQPTDTAAAQELLTALEWADSCRRLFSDGQAEALVAERVVQERDKIRTTAEGVSARLESALATAMDAVDAVGRWFPSGVAGSPLGEVPLQTLTARAREWQSADSRIGEWADYFHSLELCRAKDLGEFLQDARATSVLADALVPTLRKTIAANWLIEAYREEPALGTFSARGQEAAVREFAQMDADLQTDARLAVRYAANQRQEVVNEAARFLHPGSGNWKVPNRDARDELRLVQKEYRKRSRHLPLRRLLPQLPTILPAVKPCLLMSPLSVASYLPRHLFTFDVVIFDEASQVLPADAIGAILRAKQLIVLGDSKQLPPTRFFQRRLEDEEEWSEDEGEEIAADARAFDSILEVSGAALPATGLRWHYRSRDERLIAFSNRVFYKERPLITFPTPNLEGDTGVRFVHVADGIYDRGGTKTNIQEARLVVDLVVQHFELYGWSRSLGVIALSISQRDVIELELRRRLLEQPELEVFLAESGTEPFFIKNLETVQGDERDAIILSIGYGPSQPGGQPALAFGPVNASGGERRLNVAITRAKYSLALVSSMRPEQLDRAAQLPKEGPKVLAQYFRYAARGGRFEAEASMDAAAVPESPFEEAVLERLLQRGYQVDPQVGASGFRIDLGVRHPDIPTRYILGIECDGATYHSAASARDRDRLRQQMLEEQGWVIHRIWSTDWIQHPDDALAAVVTQIEALRTIEEPGIPIQKLPPEEAVVVEAPPPRDISPQVATLPTPFLEEQRSALGFELSRVERQVVGLRDSHKLQGAQPDKGLADDQLESTLEHRFSQIRSALHRIEAGTYGLCERCGEAIQIERLETVPYTALCRDCAQRA